MKRLAVVVAITVAVAVAAVVVVYHETLSITRQPVQLAEKDVDCCFGALCKRMTHSECLASGGRPVQDCQECER